MEKRGYQDAVDLGKAKLRQGDPALLAAFSGAVWEPPYLRLPYFNGEMRIDVRNGDLWPPAISDVEQFVIYQYLTESCAQPGPGEKYIAYLQLPQGERHHRPLQVAILEPMAKYFGADIASFERRAEALGGQKGPEGDAAYVFRYFPKISLKAIVWAGDEEFPSRAAILFDERCSRHLTTGGLYGVAEVLWEKLRQSGVS